MSNDSRAPAVTATVGETSDRGSLTPQMPQPIAITAYEAFDRERGLPLSPIGTPMGCRCLSNPELTAMFGETSDRGSLTPQMPARNLQEKLFF